MADVFFNTFVTKSLTTKDSLERFFEGILTVQMVDRQNEITVVDELMKVLPIWMDRGAPITDTHSNRIVGKGINFAKTTVVDENKIEYPAITITGKIFKDYKLDDQIWDAIKTGKYKGLSFGGATKSDRTPVKQSNGTIAYSLKDLEHYEVAVCAEPAVPLALIIDVNPLAKAMMGDKLIDRGDGKATIRCTNFGCIIEKAEISDNATGNMSASATTDEDEKDRESSIKDPTPALPRDSTPEAKAGLVDGAENLTNLNKPIRGHDWSYWDSQLESDGYDKETRGKIIGSWEKEKASEVSEFIYNQVIKRGPPPKVELTRPLHWTDLPEELKPENLEKEIGTTISAVGEQVGTQDVYEPEDRVVGEVDDDTHSDDATKKKDLSQLQGGVRTGSGYDTSRQGNTPENDSAQITEEKEPKKEEKNKIYINTDAKHINNGMTENTEQKPIEKTEEKTVTPVDSISATLSAIADTLKKTDAKIDAFSTSLKTVEDKIKALETPTNLPIKPATDDKEDIGAKVKVPDTYQSNSQQASIRDSDPKNENSTDPTGLKMQEKALGTSFTTETPRPSSAPENVNKSVGADYSEVLNDARALGHEGLSIVAKNIISGKYYTPSEEERLY